MGVWVEVGGVVVPWMHYIYANRILYTYQLLMGTYFSEYILLVHPLLRITETNIH